MKTVRPDSIRAVLAFAALTILGLAPVPGIAPALSGALCAAPARP